ncbi:sulfatase-like hydrolase/transferase [Mycobacteroides abscessus]|uniref:sulfatase-like hydrolase/transferase n=1 Tax=Mycobacteroides abscessus TaxID=36809 RepID=UPI00030252B1|nr:sulfatase-like hydrolase/transferase [Mycobacteroides abscessus]SKK12011.1 Sulfatase family protein [Mycobacteroides abscessus subsp. bolletii]
MAELNRRTVLTTGAIAAGAAAVGFGGYELFGPPRRNSSSGADGNKPNILVIMVDQMRAPQWFPDVQKLTNILPNLSRLHRDSVSFASHYTASNMCTPSRGAMTTGLYSHQTGCLYTGEGPSESSLAPQFPTWGTMLRQQGYRTWWWGKWHLGDWSDTNPEGLDAHGFSGGTFPSPNGMPNQGLQKDPSIVDQFAGWFDAEAGKGPWCTTVSLVNPHDICWWPKNPLPEDVPHWFDGLPVNFQTPDELRQHGKPRLQIDYANFMSPIMTGAVTYSGPDMARQWARCLDMYLWLQQQVDAQIGRVLDKLASRPEIDGNTIVVFTSDHGEYAGSHGLRGKGATAYEEAIRVPLYIRDPQGVLTPKPGETRTQLTSSVDLAPLLLTIGSGGNAWRSDPRFSYLAARADIAAIAKNNAAGRKWIAHVTDDMSVEEMATLLKDPRIRAVMGENAPTEIPTSAASHIVAVRTAEAKLANYSYWKPGGMQIDTSRPSEHEFYDYSTPSGKQESQNQAGDSTRQAQLQALIDNEVLPEVQAPLPAFLGQAQEQGLADMQKLMVLRGG